MNDLYWMQRALMLAKDAQKAGEVPVSALLVVDGKLVASGSNSCVTKHDPTGHAEINCLREAGVALENYRLLNSTLYVTLEPCSMCAAAIAHARVKRLVFAADDPRAGAVGSQLNLLDAPWLNHRVEVVRGVLAQECGQLLRDFFAAKRS